MIETYRFYEIVAGGWQAADRVAYPLIAALDDAHRRALQSREQAARDWRAENGL